MSNAEILTCCDGTGYTGNAWERCAEHFEPLDDIWYTHIDIED